MISVITPTYNRADLISETIKSIINQSYKDWELILVDDGSTDNTAEVIKPFLKEDNRINYVERPKDRPGGGNAARNYGFELAKGEYIKWLDSDDLLAPHCFKKQIRLMQDGKYDVVFSRSRFFSAKDEQGNFSWDKYWSPKFPTTSPFENYLFGKIRFSTADALWKKKFIGEAPFKENLRNSQEWLMYIQQLSKEPEHFLDSEVLVYSRLHIGQMHNQKKRETHYKHQVLARYYAIHFLYENELLTIHTFNYLWKSLIWFYLIPVRNRDLKFGFVNSPLIIKSLLLFIYSRSKLIRK